MHALERNYSKSNNGNARRRFYVALHETAEILSIPGYPGQSQVVPPGMESHGSQDTKYPGIPRTVPGSPTRRGVPWIPRY